jgi:hypothetical protein
MAFAIRMESLEKMTHIGFSYARDRLRALSRRENVSLIQGGHKCIFL